MTTKMKTFKTKENGFLTKKKKKFFPDGETPILLKLLVERIKYTIFNYIIFVFLTLAIMS